MLSRINITGRDIKRKEIHLQEQKQVSYGYSLKCKLGIDKNKTRDEQERICKVKECWTY